MEINIEYLPTTGIRKVYAFFWQATAGKDYLQLKFEILAKADGLTAKRITDGKAVDLTGEIRQATSGNDFLLLFPELGAETASYLWRFLNGEVKI